MQVLGRLLGTQQCLAGDTQAEDLPTAPSVTSKLCTVPFLGE